MAPNFGTVTGRVVKVLGDTSADQDNDPDIVPVDDSTVCVFTPKLPYGQNPGYGIILPQVVTAPMVNGYVMSPGNIAVAGVKLYPTDDPSTAPLNWTYGVTIKSGNLTIASFDIAVPSGSVLDLATIIPAPSSPGISVATTTAQLALATKAAQDAAASAAQAAAGGGGGTGTIADASITYAKLAAATTATLLNRANQTGFQTASTISDFTEAAQDAVAAMLAAGTGVTLAYNDASNSLTITGAAGSTDNEAVRDAIGIAMIGAGLISVVVNDASDTITISTTATANSSDATLLNRANHTGVTPVGGLGTGTPAGGKYVDGGTGAWTTLPASGGTATNDASTLTTGTLDPARIGAASIADSKLASGVAMTAAERTKLAAITGTNTGDQTNITGNAATATALATARTIGGVSFNGTANISLSSASLTDFASATDARIAAAAGVSIASLVSGKIPSSQLPAIALTQVFTYTSTALMIAANLDQGDVGVVTSGGVTTSYMRNSGTAGTLADYTVINTPDGTGITTINGYSTATVTLAASDIGLGNVNNTADSAKSVLSATKLTTARTIAGVAFDGTGNIAIPASGITFAAITGVLTSTTVQAAIAEIMTKMFPNYATQNIRFPGYGSSLPTGSTGDIYFVAG
jgi:hypothetical protein